MIVSNFILLGLLVISISIFLIAILGIFLTRRNIIIILVAIELMLLSINFNFAIFSVLLEDLVGQVFVIYILTLAGAEAAVGLAILIIFYRVRGIITTNYLPALKG